MTTKAYISPQVQKEIKKPKTSKLDDVSRIENKEKGKKREKVNFQSSKHRKQKNSRCEHVDVDGAALYILRL